MRIGTRPMSSGRAEVSLAVLLVVLVVEGGWRGGLVRQTGVGFTCLAVKTAAPTELSALGDSLPSCFCLTH